MIQTRIKNRERYTRIVFLIFFIGGVRQKPIIRKIVIQNIDIHIIGCLSSIIPYKHPLNNPPNETRKFSPDRIFHGIFGGIFLSITSVKIISLKVSVRSTFYLMIGWNMVVNALLMTMTMTIYSHVTHIGVLKKFTISLNLSI